ncbi:hypothetical protein MXB_3206 [Myxobolus squamalis]|nr:hypothetical protein MXB_3206 [Myxobolus squamalis]
MVLKKAKDFKPTLITKSSIMVGFGESKEEINQRRLPYNWTIYATHKKSRQSTFYIYYYAKVEEYVHPTVFEFYEKIGLDLGFLYVASGPLVRSSYRAGEYYITKILNCR